MGPLKNLDLITNQMAMAVIQIPVIPKTQAHMEAPNTAKHKVEVMDSNLHMAVNKVDMDQVDTELVVVVLISLDMEVNHIIPE